MPQQANEKREWITVKVSQNALIKRYDKHSFMRMPTGYYGDCTYNVYNDRIKKSTQITDLQSDSRELCFELRLDKNENIILKNQNGDETVLTAEKFKEHVDGSTNANYEFKANDSEEVRWFTSSVPNDALIIIGGGVAKAGDLLYTPLQESLKQQLFPVHYAALRVLPAHFGADAGLIGAGLMASDYAHQALL